MKRFGAWFVFVILPIALACVVLAWTPLLEIRTVDVSGQSSVKTEDILKASSLGPGSHPFLPILLEKGQRPVLNMEQAAERVMKLPWIKTARVDWLPLHTVRIRVTERKPFAKLPYLKGFLLIDEEGVILSFTDSVADESLKEIRGVPFTGYVIGRLPEMEEAQTLPMAIRVLKAYIQTSQAEDSHLYDVLNWLDVVSRDRILVRLDNRITVRFDPTVDLQYTVDFAREIFFRHIKPEEKGMIDFTRGRDPSFLPE